MSGSMPFLRLDNYDPSGSDYGRPKLVVFLWYLLQETLFRYSPVPCYGFRRWLLTLFGCKLGQGARVRPRARLHYPWRIEIGDHSAIGDDAWLYSMDTIKIGAHSVISQKSFLCTASHDYRDPRFRLTHQPITVGNGVWIAADVYVAPGVTIGDNAVIGARSSVFHDMPPGMVCYGYPCRPIKPRGQ
jgi:putative colanic acid biosynthesis acetyltransferase WcaF